MKRFFAELFLAISSCALFALPGFVPPIEDLPGQYVYYADKTFERESYAGFLMFDKNTYAARYYAPEDKKSKKPAVEVEIYFTLQGDADHINLTGEKIIKGFSLEDTEFVNYLHDMVYELNSRRSKLTELTSERKNYIKSDYFPQFGGRVAIEYDALVPLFNVRSVFQEESKPDFFIVTAGQISGSNDRSFEDFKGFPSKFDDKKHSMPKTAKSELVRMKGSGDRTVTLDTAWKSAMDNVWILGDAALVSMSALPAADPDFVTRQLLLTNGTNFLDWNSVRLDRKDSKITINGIFYDPYTKHVSRNFKTAIKTADGYDFFTLTVYDVLYQKNRRYFSAIVQSYQ